MPKFERGCDHPNDNPSPDCLPCEIRGDRDEDIFVLGNDLPRLSIGGGRFITGIKESDGQVRGPVPHDLITKAWCERFAESIRKRALAGDKEAIGTAKFYGIDLIVTK